MKQLARRLLVPIAALLVLTACSSPMPTPTVAPTSPPATEAPPATQTPAEPTLVPTLVPTLAPPNAGDAGTPAPLPPQSIDDLAKIKASGVLSVGLSADYPPYEFYNSDFKIDGFDPALINDLAKRLGVKADINDFAFDGVLAALQLGQVDAVISALSVTPERQQLIDFSNTYYIGTDGILGQPNSTDVKLVANLAGKRVGAQKGSVYATYLKENLVDKGLSKPTDIFLYQDVSGAIRDLKDDKIDYFMLDRLPARTFAKAENLKVVGEGLNPQSFAIAVRKGSNLAGALNDALLKSQNDGTVANFIQEHLGIAKNQIEPIPTPTPVPPPTPGPTATPAGPPPCVNGAAYVADLNLDDQNMTAPPVMSPGQTFTKGWRMRNSGNCNWPASFFMGFVFGNTSAAQMGGQPTPVGRVVAPGQTVDINVNLQAPGQPGTYQGFWQMNDTGGTPFGERVWVGITVPNPNPPTAVPPTAVPGISFTANPTVINQGQCTTFNWNVQGVQGVWFFPAGQPYQNFGVPGVGSQQQCPQQTTTYYLRVQFNDGSVQQPSITITVNPAGGNGPVITQFTVDPTQISVGQCVNIQWQVTGNVARVALLSNGQAIWDGAPATGSYQNCPPAQGEVTYTLQTFGSDGVAVQTSRQVSVSGSGGGSAPVIYSFTADQTTIKAGSSVTLRWDAGGGATNVQLQRDYIVTTNLTINGSVLNGYTYDTPVQAGAISGNVQVGYKLTATNAQGQAVQSVVVITVMP